MQNRTTPKISCIPLPIRYKGMLGEDLKKWTQVRNEADPEGMFLGEWHRRTLGLEEFALEEHEVKREKAADGGQFWVGEVDGARLSRATTEQQTSREKSDSPSASSSGESFDMMHGAEAEKSVLFSGSGYDEDEGELTDRGEPRYHPGAREKITGTAVV